MLDPYRMVIVNIISSLILLIGIVFYKFIFPRKNINLLILLILISLLPLISLLRKGTYESGDLSLHVKYVIPFYESLKEGNILPRWSDILCDWYGCPKFIFMYLSPYYFISLFHFLGISFINSTKILLGISFMASGIGMYYFVKEELKNKFSAFVSAIFYLFAPYHLVNLHFRADIAEVFSFVFIPLNFLATKKIIEGKRVNLWFVLQAFFLLLAITTHQAISLASFPFIILYGLLIWHRRKKNEIKKIIYYFLSIIAGLLLSAFYWLPIIVERKNILWGANPGMFFLSLSDIFYSSWRHGFLFQGPKGELSFLVGYIQWLLVFISVFIIIRIKKKNGLLIFSVISFFTIILITQAFSKPIWDIIPLIKNFQFSYRLLLLASFFTAIIAGIITNKVNNQIFVILLCVFAIFSTILNWGNRRTIPEIDDGYLQYELEYGDLGPSDFTAPIWSEKIIPQIKKPPKSSIEIIEGKAEAIKIFRSSTKHEYIIKTDSNVKIRENTFYYPGWVLKVNNKVYPIDFKNPKHYGIITFDLKKGIYKAELIFIDTPVRTISGWISFTTLIFLLLYLIQPCLNIRHFRKFN